MTQVSAPMIDWLLCLQITQYLTVLSGSKLSHFDIIKNSPMISMRTVESWRIYQLIYQENIFFLQNIRTTPLTIRPNWQSLDRIVPSCEWHRSHLVYITNLGRHHLYTEHSTIWTHVHLRSFLPIPGVIRQVLAIISTLICSYIMICVLSSQHGHHYTCFRLRGLDLAVCD